MKAPNWVLRTTLEAVHDAQLMEHGGAAGLRDEGLLESALARPINLFSYGEMDVCALAEAYAFGIVRNHPFVDGNKRTAFLAASIFMRMNGLRPVADEVAAARAMLTLAADEMSESDFATWLRENSKADTV
jgi:death on curing protein